MAHAMRGIIDRINVLPWIDRFSHTQETPAELLGIMAWEFYDKITILHTSYSIFP
jgi:cell fate (sporulation/competence/biofilm development) regulator YmcA (YheA/YmcA/DUF963 family)